MAEEDIERLDGELQRALDAVVSKTPPDTQPRPPRTRLERWAIALRVMAWISWLGGLVYLVVIIVGLADSEAPVAMVIAAVLQALFIIALGGMLLYAYSYHLVGIDCIVENTALTAEAALAGKEQEDEEAEDQDNE